MGSHAPRAGTTSPSSSSSSSAASSSNESHGKQLLLVLFRGTLHGHTSPMLLQFARRRRLVRHGLNPTLVTTCYFVLLIAPAPPSPFRVAAISDGFNDAGHA